MRLLVILVFFASTIVIGNDGRGIDPNGGLTATQRQRGTIDPDGSDPGAAALLNGDRGAGLDPNG